MKHKRKAQSSRLKKPRKPKTLYYNPSSSIILAEILIDGVAVESHFLYQKECRKLAAWLIRAAEYLDSKDEHKT